jgi:hypothetical protein
MQEYSKEKYSKEPALDGSPIGNPQTDRSALIEQIARTYPGNKTLTGLMIPHIIEKAIRDATRRDRARGNRRQHSSRSGK